jgi:hypothetical protein
MQHLERHFATGRQVNSAVDDALAATVNLARDLVAWKVLGRYGWASGARRKRVGRANARPSIEHSLMGGLELLARGARMRRSSTPALEWVAPNPALLWANCHW